MKVDKGIPLPSKWPFSDMEIGDSFALPENVRRTTVSVAAMRYGRTTGKKFTVRKMPDKTFRCWRLT